MIFVHFTQHIISTLIHFPFLLSSFNKSPDKIVRAHMIEFLRASSAFERTHLTPLASSIGQLCFLYY